MPQSTRHISEWSNFEIKKVFKQARRCLKHSGLDILLHPKMQNLGRILVVTPGKIGNAVHRNKVRRRLKSLFFEHLFDQQGLDCIVIMKKEGINLSYDQLKDLMAIAFKNSHNLNRTHENRS